MRGGGDVALSKEQALDAARPSSGPRAQEADRLNRIHEALTPKRSVGVHPDRAVPGRRAAD
jgi:hypothetical protein